MYSSLDSNTGLDRLFQTRRNVKILIGIFLQYRNWHKIESSYSEKSGENYGLKLCSTIFSSSIKRRQIKCQLETNENERPKTTIKEWAKCQVWVARVWTGPFRRDNPNRIDLAIWNRRDFNLPLGLSKSFPRDSKICNFKTKAQLPSQVFRSGLYTNPLGQVQTKLPGVFLHCPLSQRRLLSTHSLISGKTTNENVCKRLFPHSQQRSLLG